jgi:hypothetical protein
MVFAKGDGLALKNKGKWSVTYKMASSTISQIGCQTQA